MFRGEAKPNRMTWLMWAIAPLVGTAAAVSKGVEWSILPVFMAGFSPLLIFIFSFVSKNAYWKLTRFDYLCGFFSLAALVLWGITKEADIATIFAILSDGAAAVPTITKAWKHPETENHFPFTAGLLGNVASIFAIKTWVFSAYAFPAYLVAINVALLFSIFRKKFMHKI